MQDQGGRGDLFEPGIGRGVVGDHEVVADRASHVPGSVHLPGRELLVARLVEPKAARIRPLGVDAIRHHGIPVVPVGFGVGLGERGHHLLTRRWQFTLMVGGRPRGLDATRQSVRTLWRRYSIAMRCAMPPPIDNPTRCARSTPKESRIRSGSVTRSRRCTTAVRAASWTSGRCHGGRSG